jgi:hypothetical protein
METLGPGEEKTLRLRKGVYQAIFILIASEGGFGLVQDVVVESKERWLFRFNASLGRLEMRAEP